MRVYRNLCMHGFMYVSMCFTYASATRLVKLGHFQCFLYSPRCILTTRVNPESLGCHDPQNLDGQSWGPPRSIIISNNVQIYEVRTLSKSRDFRNIKNCIQLNKNSGDDTFNPVLCAS